MRIVVSDYSGHPFQVQLSRGLAKAGHDVLHVTSAAFQTPKGNLDAGDSDPSRFRSVAVRTKKPFAKATLLRRRGQEIEVGKLIAEQIAAHRPDVVISSNAPLDTQVVIERAARRQGARFIFWVQDIYSEAIARILGAKLGPLGALIGRYYRAKEARLLRAADHNVVIAAEFIDPVKRLAGIGDDRITVIENWAPLDEIPPLPRDNDWARANLPDAPFRMIYSGTLGFKHDPGVLLRLARETDYALTVFSEGEAAEALRRDAAEQGVGNLEVRGWLPFAVLPHALAGADALIVILEPDAGIFSVPSKVLTYLCVGRQILGAIPGMNLAARLIRDGAGFVVEPGDAEALVAAARRMAGDPALRASQAAFGRAYAERTFDIDAITARFEAIIKND